jgi:hypothetical protein
MSKPPIPFSAFDFTKQAHQKGELQRLMVSGCNPPPGRQRLAPVKKLLFQVK